MIQPDSHRSWFDINHPELAKPYLAMRTVECAWSLAQPRHDVISQFALLVRPECHESHWHDALALYRLLFDAQTTATAAGTSSA